MRLVIFSLAMTIGLASVLSGPLAAQQTDSETLDSVKEAQKEAQTKVPADAPKPVLKNETVKKENTSNPDFRPSEEISEDEPVAFPIDI